MATWPGGSCWSFCCCAGFLGVITLKPEATSMLSLFWVLVCVLAQPIVSANSAAALIILNDTICFIFMVPCGLWLFGFVLSALENWRKNVRSVHRLPLYRTLVQHARVAERTTIVTTIRRCLLANSTILVS